MSVTVSGETPGITVEGEGSEVNVTVVTGAGSGGGGASALAGLTDVDVTTDPPAGDDVLAWDEDEEKWTPATLSSDPAPVDSVNGQTGVVVLDATDVGAIATTARGQANGVASLDGDGTIPDIQHPASIARDTEVTAAVTAHDASGTAHPDIRALIGASYTQFVYNSAGAQTGNRYNDWSDLIDAIADAPAGRKSILFEQDETIPDGAWNLDFCTLVGNNSDAWLDGHTVTFPAGATLSSWQAPIISDAIAVLNQDTPLLEVTDTLAVLVDRGAFFAAEDAEVFRVTATGATVSISLLIESRLFNGPEATLDQGAGAPTFGNYEIINDAGTSNTVVIVLDGPRSTVTAGPVIRGGASGGVGVLINHDGTPTRIAWTNPNYSGYSLVINALLAENMLVDGSGFSTLSDTIDDVQEFATAVDTALASAGGGQRFWKTAPPASAYSSLSGMYGMPPWDIAGNVSAESYALGQMVLGYCEVTGAITTVTFEVSATNLTGSQAVILVCYAIGTNGRPTGAPLWTESKAVGASTGTYDITLTRTLPTDGCVLGLLNPSGNAGTVSIYNFQPTGPYHLATRAVNNRPAMQTTGHASAPDLTGYTFSSAPVASAFGYSQRMPLLFLKG